MTGIAFLNRFDLLMRLNEETKKPLDINPMQLLNPQYFQQHIGGDSSGQKVKSFFRGMIDDSLLALEEEGLRIVIQISYSQTSVEFTCHYELQIYNERAEKIFMMCPRLFHEDGITFENEDVFTNNLEVPPKQSLRIPLNLKVGQVDLGNFFPSVMSFFVFSKSELEGAIQGYDQDFERFSKKICLPVNLTRFFVFYPNGDFTVVGNLKLTEEMKILNPRLNLADIKMLLPNLSRTRNFYDYLKIEIEIYNNQLC